MKVPCDGGAAGGRAQGHGLDGREQGLIRTPHNISDRAFADELVAAFRAVVGSA